MNEKSPIFVPIKMVPKSALASLHLRYLSTPFSGRPGQKLLELYYDALSVADQAIGIAAVMNDRTVGFSCAVGDFRQIQRNLLLHSPFWIVSLLFLQILYKPQVVGGLVRRLAPRKIQTKHWNRPANLTDWYTYRPIIVDESYRVHRIADLLTERLLAEVRQRNVPGIISIVDRSNFRSVRHFSRNGFQEIWRNEPSIIFGRRLIHS